MKTNNIVLSVVNAEKHKDMLGNIPHKRVMDWAMVCRTVTQTSPEAPTSSVIINNIMLGKLGLTEERLFEIAEENTLRDFTPRLEEIQPHFFVLSNDQRMFGAVDALICDAIPDLAEHYKKDLFVLPSSIHEVFIVPDYGNEPEYLKSVIEDANRTVVRPKDVLSDNLYRYNRQTNSLEIVRIK